MSHHHHLDPGPLNRLIEKRVVDGVRSRWWSAASSARRQLRAELGARTDHVVVVPYGVDARFAPGRGDGLRARYGPRGRRVVLFFGGLKPRKNLGLLLDVWRGAGARRLRHHAL